MGQGTSGGRRPGGIKDRQLDWVQGTRWEASNAQREIPAFTLQHSEAKGKIRTTEPYREGGHFTKLPGASAELREEKRPGRRCCRQWGGLSSWERKGVQDRVLEQTGKGDAMLDKEGHGGEGAREATLCSGKQEGGSPRELELGVGFSREPNYKPSKQPTRPRVPSVLHESPKPKVALGKLAFLPEKQGQALRSQLLEKSGDWF